jgi:thiol:disulfide interchange protein DsbD
LLDVELKMSKRFGWPLFAAFFLLSFAALAAPQAILSADQAFRVSATRSPDGQVVLQWTIAPGHYLYRDTIAVDAKSGAVPLATQPGVVKDDPVFGRSEVYFARAEADFVPPDRSTVSVAYRGCQENGICYPPVHKTLDLRTLQITDSGRSLAPADSSGWQTAKASPPPASRTAAVGSAGGEEAGGSLLADLAIRGGLALVILSFAGFGLLLAFTPCVLPMYPILGGMLARQGEALSLRRGLVTSSVYVAAMASAFGFLGIAAAWSGQNLQLTLQSPVAIGVIASVFVLLALSSFGLFDMALPAVIAERIGRVGSGRRGTLVSAAILGFTSALIVGPCVTPPLAAALLYVAGTGNVALGAAALFALGFGQGIPLIAFGAFGSGVLPKAGAWMEATKKAFGFVFLATAIWMASRIIPGSITMVLWAALSVAAGVFLGAFDASHAETGVGRRLGKAAGLLSALYGGVLLIGAAAGSLDPLKPIAILVRGVESRAVADSVPAFDDVSTSDGLEKKLAAAIATSRPTLVYFTADWCVSCRSIDRNVLDRPVAGKVLAGFDLLRVDLTRLDPAKQNLMTRYGVVGPPTMIFFAPGTPAKPTTRLVGELTLDELLATVGTLGGAGIPAVISDKTRG